jgi:sulfhydrogenase subunit beta (sulfur reductase)
MTETPAQRSLLSVEGLGALLGALRGEGYQLVGPRVRDGAIVHGEIDGVDDLPAGYTERQEAGTYRLERRPDGALFGYSVGPQSWKQYFFVPRLRLWRARRKEGGGFGVELDASEPPKLAIIGARSCDLHAIAIQDRVFLRGPAPDPDYAARRRGVFVVAVQCGQAGGTCFCASMKTGPRATFGFDLALTELFEPHRFVVEVGSERGAELLGRLPAAEAGEAGEADVGAAEAAVERTAKSMGRAMNAEGVRELLLRNPEHPRWGEVAERCLSCSNCTLACPTCFCSSVEDVSDLSGDAAERVRRWDSCFTLDHSYLHGGSVRASTRARYRQWLTHKLATWVDQFGVSGCVGCGRCVTWCPVGIDITEEVAAIRATDGALDGPGAAGGPAEVAGAGRTTAEGEAP